MDCDEYSSRVTVKQANVNKDKTYPFDKVRAGLRRSILQSVSRL